MRHRPFTLAWAEAFRDAIEADALYRAAAAAWTWPVAFVLQPAPEFGYAESIAVELTLDRGRCHAAAVTTPESVKAPIVLAAPYATWKAIVTGALDPIAGVTRGLVSVSGSMTVLMLNARAATALLACAKSVPTLFPDEA